MPHRLKPRAAHQDEDAEEDLETDAMLPHAEGSKNSSSHRRHYSYSSPPIPSQHPASRASAHHSSQALSSADPAPIHTPSRHRLSQAHTAETGPRTQASTAGPTSSTSTAAGGSWTEDGRFVSSKAGHRRSISQSAAQPAPLTAALPASTPDSGPLTRHGLPVSHSTVELQLPVTTTDNRHRGTTDGQGPGYLGVTIQGSGAATPSHSSVAGDIGSAGPTPRHTQGAIGPGHSSVSRGGVAAGAAERADGEKTALLGTAGGVAGGGGSGRRAQDDDDDEQETWSDRLAAHPAMVKLNAWVDRVMQSQVVAVLFDIIDVLLFALDIFTDILVVEAMHNAGYQGWETATLLFITWHFVLMAVLICLFFRRTTQQWQVCGITSHVFKAGLWLFAIPLAIPVVLVLDMAMLFTSTAPVFFPDLFASFSSFMSNYNFTRLFVEFVGESIPQTILQTYIYYYLIGLEAAALVPPPGPQSLQPPQLPAPVYPPSPPPTAHHAPDWKPGSQVLSTSEAAKRAVVLSLVISSINTVKFGWKLWKAANDAGLQLHHYFKYLLLLKGNYECPPATLTAVIQKCCSKQQGTFVMNGFPLHRDKARFGPAQQAYVLLNAFSRCRGRKSVTRWTCAGCPLASINRILEAGLGAFRNLQALELAECAVRGDTLNSVFKAVRKHQHLSKVKLVQSGILKKYRNVKRDAWAGMLKPKLGLTHFAVCTSWWGDTAMLAAAEHLSEHPALESLAIEYPVLQTVDEEDKSLGKSKEPFSGAGNMIRAALEAGGGGVVGTAAGGAAAAATALGIALTAASDWLAEAGSKIKTLTGHRKNRGPIVSAAYVVAVAQILRTCHTLRSLALHRHLFTEQGVVVIASAIRDNHHVTSLSLANCTLGGDAGAAALAAALRSNHAVVKLSLAGCGIGTEGLVALCNAIAESKSITNVDLSANRADGSVVNAMGRVLRLSSCLATLSLDSWGTALVENEPAAASLCSALASNRHVRRLSLANTALSKRIATELSSALTKEAGCQLAELDLSQRDKAAADPSTVDGVVTALSGVLGQPSSTLTSLNLEGNALGSSGVGALADALCGCTALTSLNLGRCGLTDTHVMLVAEACLSAPGLKHLNLSGAGPLAMRGARALSALLHTAAQPYTDGSMSDATPAAQARPPHQDSNPATATHRPPRPTRHARSHSDSVPAALHTTNPTQQQQQGGTSGSVGGGPHPQGGAARFKVVSKDPQNNHSTLTTLDLSFVNFAGLTGYTSTASHPILSTVSSTGGFLAALSRPISGSQGGTPAKQSPATPSTPLLAASGNQGVWQSWGGAGDTAGGAAVEGDEDEGLPRGSGHAEGLVKVLAAGLACNTTLTTLSLAHCALPEPALRVLGSAVASPGVCLRHLDLSGCVEGRVRAAFTPAMQCHLPDGSVRLQSLKATSEDGSYEVVDLMNKLEVW